MERMIRGGEEGGERRVVEELVRGLWMFQEKYTF